MQDLFTINASNRKPEADEYQKDGLIYCKKCGTQRETIITNPFTGCEQKVRCICNCQKEAREKEDELLREDERQRVIKRAQIKCFGRSGYEGCIFPNDDQADAENSKYCKNYATRFPTFLASGQGLLLIGGYGTGKTFHAACIANDLIQRGYSVIMTSTPDLMDHMQRNTFEDDSILDEVTKCDLLILDDLGAERGTETAHERVYSVIDGRYRANLPMVISTNISPDDLKHPKDAASARIYDRILEKCLPIKYQGPNRRKSVNYASMREALL